MFGAKGTLAAGNVAVLAPQSETGCSVRWSPTLWEARAGAAPRGPGRGVLTTQRSESSGVHSQPLHPQSQTPPEISLRIWGGLWHVKVLIRRNRGTSRAPVFRWLRSRTTPSPAQEHREARSPNETSLALTRVCPHRTRTSFSSPSPKTEQATEDETSDLTMG